jgi:hypothetical protein
MRKVFSTPKLAEFATRPGLTTRVGVSSDWWPEVALKELADNAIDDAETHGLPPVVRVTIEDQAVIVQDQGRGVDPDVVARIFDYDRQTSSREAYVEPTRGAQGNALQTILAMPFVLSGDHGELVIDSRGVRHDLSFTIDPVTMQPVIEHARSPSDVTTGTRVTVKWSSSLAGDRLSLELLAERFAYFNPHLEIRINDAGIAASDPPLEKAQAQSAAGRALVQRRKPQTLDESFRRRRRSEQPTEPDRRRIRARVRWPDQHPEGGGDRRPAGARPHNAFRTSALP